MPASINRNKANNATAKVAKIHKPRSIFPMKKTRKMTFKASYITPIFFEEVMPGDTWDINLNAFIRMLPQVAPPMDNLVVSTFFFFEPCRLTWEHFANQHGEKKNPDDTIDYITPSINTPEGGFKVKSLQDYLGKPVGVEIKTTSFGERMYNNIYNEYFRSSILQDSVFTNDSDQDDVYTNYELLKITKPHDYFTDAAPTLQQGDPISIPLGTTAPVMATGDLLWTTGNDTIQSALQVNSNVGPSASYKTPFLQNANIASSTSKQLKYSSGLVVDLTNAASAQIAALRLMIRTQEILEADNRSGVRYTELLQNRYGCVNPDLLLYRPQYLGGTKSILLSTPVVQTSGTGTTGQNTPQGNMAGYCQRTDTGNVIHQSFGEFGHIMGLIAVSAIPQYQYGLHRKFSRYERFDYMYPEFMGISDQAVKNKELFAQDDTITDSITGGAVNDEVWGYTGRYDEYRYFNNEICGELRSNYSQSLDVWTYAENMEDLQVLNGEFLNDKSDVIVQRSMAVQSDNENDVEDQFLLDCAFYGSVTRVLTSKAIPQTGGRLF